MCLRPDIVFVTPRPVYETYMALEAQGLLGESLGFYEHCEKQVGAAHHTGDTDAEQHWRKVFDFGMRYGCSRFSAVEVDGERMNAALMPVTDEDTVRLYIGNPMNPPHEHAQPKITQTRMAALNKAWPCDSKLTGPLRGAATPPRLVHAG